LASGRRRRPSYLPSSRRDRLHAAEPAGRAGLEDLVVEVVAAAEAAVAAVAVVAAEAVAAGALAEAVASAEAAAPAPDASTT
jgi:hypothetical protein